MKLGDQHHFEVRAHQGPIELAIACIRCPWEWTTEGEDEWPDLADLIQRADEHLDLAHGGGS